MDGNEFIATAKEIVARKADDIRIGTVLTTQQMMKPIKENEVHVVWVAKVLQNNKGLFIAERIDGFYFEVTYNGDKREFYVDTYEKALNNRIRLEDA